jgi:hypothetical protein
MMISLFYFVSWLLLRGAHFVRPSALQRGYALIWLFIITWIVSVFAAVAEDRMNIGAVYPLVFLHTFVFGALLISLLEQFALPSKQAFARQLAGEDEEDDDAGDDDDNGADQSSGDGDDAAPTPTETTPLRAGEEGYGSNEQTTTFASTYRRSVSESRNVTNENGGRVKRSLRPYQNEQAWSGRLPNWTWFIQLLLLAPLYVIVLGNLALVQTRSMAMTGTDGSSLLVPLMGVGILSILLLLPLTPFIHRISHHVPVFLLFVFIGTLIYNLVAFPFSVNNRFKFFFQQVIDLDEGTNVVNLLGLEDFVRPVISSLPTPAGQQIECFASASRTTLKDCRYDASLLPPDLANGEKLEDLVTVQASKSGNGKSIIVALDALNTRTCYLDTSSPFFGFSVEGGGKRDERFGSFPREGLQHIQLWRRDWEGAWNVTLQLGGNGLATVQDSAEDAHAGVLADDSGNEELKMRAIDEFSVTARCLWSDANGVKTIPALHEVKQYMPSWAIVTKKSVGLVEVKKTVKVT